MQRTRFSAYLNNENYDFVDQLSREKSRELGRRISMSDVLNEMVRQTRSSENVCDATVTPHS